MIKQRILYVGIGGSGLDLGLKLDEALRREICGLDGRALLRRPEFQQLRVGQLPDFVQSIYIDFAADSAAAVSRSVGNATWASNLIPTIDNYPALADSLRMDQRVKYHWLPPYSEEEPRTRPLSAGAGQFPTVGRAALFSAIKSQGYLHAIGNDLKRAIGKLGMSLGALNAYTNGDASSGVSVYIGFSMSGGTGCGIFLDVIQLLMHELHQGFNDVRTAILPVVLLPSTFDKLLAGENERRSKLNAARAILDLAELAEQVHSPSQSRREEFVIQYPDMALGTSGEVSFEYDDRAPSFPVITLVSRPPVMNRDDVARSVAASIVAQSSMVKRVTEGGVENRNSFGEDLINLLPEITRPHRYGFGQHALMPMVSASLTLPSQRLSERVTREILVAGLEKVQEQLQMQPDVSEEQKLQFLRHLGFSDFIDPQTFPEVTSSLIFQPRENPKNMAELESAVGRLKSQIARNRVAIEARVKEEVVKHTTFAIVDALRAYLTAEQENGVDILEALQVARASLDFLETRTGAEVAGSAAGAERTRRRGFRLLPRRLSGEVVRKRFAKEEHQFKALVRDMWWREWSSRSVSWSASMEQARSLLADIQRLVRDFVEDSKQRLEREAATIAESRVGVVTYVPTGGLAMEDALDKLRDDTVSRLRQRLQVDDLSPDALLKRLAVVDDKNAWKDMVTALDERRSRDLVEEALLDPVRGLVEGAMVGSDQLSGTLPPLGRLLREATDASGHTESANLRKILGDLVPASLLPEGPEGTARVLVSYPGETSAEVEQLLRETLGLTPKFASMLNRKEVTTMIATGNSDVLTVNVNYIGQGLLDNPETRGILQFWMDSNNPADLAKWRQRRGFKNLEQLSSGRTQDDLVNRLLRALFAGRLVVAEGNLNDPRKLKMLSQGEGVGAHLDIVFDVPPLYGFSSWPNIIRGFERTILTTIDGENKGRVIESVLNSVPSVLIQPNETIPEVVRVFLGMRKEELAKLESAKVDHFAEPAQRAIANAKEFWGRTLGLALERPITAAFLAQGQNLTYASLTAALAHAANPVEF